jgi:glycosyltransferase involved in cell wall biosynthesis
MNVYLNGRFLTQPFSGVQRYSLSLVRALDALLAEGAAPAGGSFALLCPPGTPPPELRRIEVRRVGRRQGQAWEQLDLPRHARGGLLVSLGNTAPLTKRAQVVAIHDIASFVVPEAFSPAFRRWYRFLMPALGRLARRVATVSRFSAGELTRHAGIPQSKIRVVYNAADHMLETAPDPRVLERAGVGDGPYVLAVGNRAPHKNFRAVLEAQALLGDVPYEFVHVGEANPRVFGHVGEHAAERARSVGRVTDGELRALYERAACFVFPSIYEGFGLPPLEAMTCGCPVVAAEAASIPEVCGDAALYFDPRDPAALAERIAQVMGDAELRAELSRRGRERAERFSWRRSAEALLEVIREAAGDQSPRPR